MEIDKATLQEMRDRQEILACITRYCRGVDRLDREILASAYHHDAIEDHGFYVGPVSGFINWVIELHSTHQEKTQHFIANHYCEIDGDVAHAETYFLFRCINRQAPYRSTASGRYIDRFEKRDGRWAVAVRVCVSDILDGVWEAGSDPGRQFALDGARDKTDPSYMRPLVVDRARFTI